MMIARELHKENKREMPHVRAEVALIIKNVERETRSPQHPLKNIVTRAVTCVFANVGKVSVWVCYECM